MSGTRHSERPFGAVVVVGSQGARRAFEEAAACLPADFPAAIVFALHRSDAHGVTEQLLARRIALPVRGAVEGQKPQAATVYVAPWDRQLAFDEEGRLRITDRGDGVLRYALGDGLLVSAARVLGPRLIAVVLSGRLDGGAIGVTAVKRHGGRVLVQDPATAEAPSMPTAALATGCVDFAFTPPMLGHCLAALCGAPGAAELFRVRLNAGVRG
jgi:two-component system chemotaxis response regulator CheB